MRKLLITLAALSISAVLIAQPSGNSDKYVESIQMVADQAADARAEADLERAERYIREAIMIFNSQPVQFQETNEALKSELFYDLTRYLALQNKHDEAIAAFADAVDLGWDNYAFAKSDSDLASIKKDKTFKSIMRAIK